MWETLLSEILKHHRSTVLVASVGDQTMDGSVAADAVLTAIIEDELYKDELENSL